MRVVIKKWGNSAAVRLPSSMLKSLRVGLDDLMEVRVEKGCLILQPVRDEQYTLAQLVGGIKPGNVHEEVDYGSL
jgi:Growth regulator